MLWSPVWGHKWPASLLFWGCKDTGQGRGGLAVAPANSDAAILGTGRGFAVLQEGSFSCSGACLGFWLHLKEGARTHKAGRLWLLKTKSQDGSSLLQAPHYTRLSLTPPQALLNQGVVTEWLPPLTPTSLNFHWNAMYWGIFFSCNELFYNSYARIFIFEEKQYQHYVDRKHLHVRQKTWHYDTQRWRNSNVYAHMSSKHLRILLSLSHTLSPWSVGHVHSPTADKWMEWMSE